MADRLPVLPLPYPTVLLPGGTLTLTLSRSQLDALAAALDPSSKQPLVAAAPLIPLSLADSLLPNPSSQPESAQDTTPTPTPARLHTHGVSARVTHLSRTRTGAYVLTLRALSRVSIHPPSPPPPPSSPYPADPDAVPVLRCTPLPAPPAPPAAVRAFKGAAARALAGSGRLAALVDAADDARAPAVADALAGVLGVEWRDKIQMLSLEPPALLAHVTALLEARASLGRAQRAAALRQHLAAVRAELDALQPSSGTGTGAAPTDDLDLDGPSPSGQHQDGSGNGGGGNGGGDGDPDGMAALKRRIAALAPGSEERRVAAAEWRRLRRIPSASAEWGVVRTYLDWLTALPWPASSPPPSDEGTGMTTRAFLARARAQLDADHYGLDRVKRRLVEHLAVVRLLETQERAALSAEKAAATNFAANAEKDKENGEVKEDAKERALVKYDGADADVPTLGPARAVPEKQKQAPNTKSKRRVAKGPILLFIGPPGTGKTSLGSSVARALGRPFERIALGGVRDEGEIRGHRRTYVAAGPGAIVQALRRAGRCDPVILLDEVDKVGQNNFQGDPGAALLEVLDPEQNHTFTDHYVGIPVDLSQVLFICTANSLDTIAPPLLDRCEVVQLSGYTSLEKTHIARRFLLPKQLARNGLPAARLAMDDDVLRELVQRYTREAGVRALERAVAGVVRFKAVEWAESVEGEGEAAAAAASYPSLSPPGAASESESATAEEQRLASAEEQALALAKPRVYSPLVTVDDLETILGVARFDADEAREREARAGIVHGLVVTGMGEGEVMPVESVAVPGRGALKLTGSLGDVIKESGELALSWVKTHAHALRITRSPAVDALAERGVDVHLHLPSGAQKKDGPSAGVAITCAFVSLLTGVCVPADVAMTGEITLRGRVTPVGGIKEKVLGAHRAGVRTVILPWANRKDAAQDVPAEVRARVRLVFVRTVREALDAAFGAGALPWRGSGEHDEAVGLVQSRL